MSDRQIDKLAKAFYKYHMFVNSEVQCCPILTQGEKDLLNRFKEYGKNLLNPLRTTGNENTDPGRQS